jgi:hypothetical protein
VSEVWIVEGWFGDQEWIEAVCATEEKAEEIAAERWKTRTSEKLHPQSYLQGHAKFAAVRHEVVS